MLNPLDSRKTALEGCSSADGWSASPGDRWYLGGNHVRDTPQGELVSADRQTSEIWIIERSLLISEGLARRVDRNRPRPRLLWQGLYGSGPVGLGRDHIGVD